MSKDLIIRKNSSEYTTISGVTKVQFEAQTGGNVIFIPEDEIPAPNLQNKTTVANGVVTADSGYDGLSTVTVSVPSDSGGGISASRYIIFGLQSRILLNYSQPLFAFTREINAYHDKYLRMDYLDEASLFGSNNFYDYSNLEELEINCDYVHESAFRECLELKELKLHNTSSMGDGCFVGCPKLSNVYFYGSYVMPCPINKSEPSDDYSFLNSPASPLTLTIHVPESLIGDYRSAWSAFSTCEFVSI